MMALCMFASLSQAGHALGVTYSEGYKDVVSWHEDNLFVVADNELPVSISYRYIQSFESGLRLDGGVSFFYTGGDIDYYDLPVQITLGYNFLKDTGYEPYIRGGMSYHFTDGDFVESSAGLGFLGALGIEIGDEWARFFMEVSYDTAQATFSTTETDSIYTRAPSEKELAVSGVMFSVGLKF
jgi:hypothetical protein